jgi:hypothetical protein
MSAAAWCQRVERAPRKRHLTVKFEDDVVTALIDVAVNFA